MKKLALMWKNLPAPERKVYEEIAEADKARYYCHFQAACDQSFLTLFCHYDGDCLRRYFQELSTYSGPMQVPNKRRKKNPVSLMNLCAPVDYFQWKIILF